MKKQLIKLSVALTLILSVSSCAFHTGMIQGSAILQSNNFVYVKRDVSGTAAASYFLGLGGLGKDELVSEAKKDVIAKNKIKDNQTLVNITVGAKRTIVFPLVFTNRYTMTADVVEYK